jgi:3-oxoacyl-[acyl-carrier-protein] synthase-3
MSRVKPEDVDMVINCCSTPTDAFGDATSIAHKAGCVNAVAFDLTAACSGFLFGIVTASQFLQTTAKNVLVVGGDSLSQYVDWSDRNSCILFGDGAGALMLSSDGGDGDGGNGVLGYAIHSDGSGQGDLLCTQAPTAVTIGTPTPVDLSAAKPGFIKMNGKKVYSFATRVVPTVLEEALVKAGLGVNDVDHLLLHQANIRIMDTVAKRMGIPESKIISNLEEYGNTSAGSIPLALDEAVRSGKVKRGDVIACAGFGAGLSWGGAILKWHGPDRDESDR